MQMMRRMSIETPEWNGKLRFRGARKEEAEGLKGLYEAAWGPGIEISAAQIEAKIGNFPQGQIVAFEDGSERPVSMINIMLAPYSPLARLSGGYERITGGRTFSTHLPFEDLMALLDAGAVMLPIAICASIAVHPDFRRNGYAHETLNYAISFAEANGLIAVPYSAPRGFGAARLAEPGLAMMDYLHRTLPSDQPHLSYLEKLQRLERRAGAAFADGFGMPRPTEDRYRFYNSMPPDRAGEPTAFSVFSSTDGPQLRKMYGREMTIEDFCILSGRRHADPTMRMHIENGARFLRDGGGGITSVFEGSRPEDRAAAGYNIALSYGYHPLFGHYFATT